MTTIYFVRHAEPNLSNHDDKSRELSPKGLQDRKLVSEYLKDKGIDLVISSPYKRAIDTLVDFADLMDMEIVLEDRFKERKVGNEWIADFEAFTKRQWLDFDYKLFDGECLAEVQERNVEALREVLETYDGKNIVIGSHGTALSTIINHYDPSFGYSDFEKIRHVMPWVVQFVFDETSLIAIHKYDLFAQEKHCL